MLTPIVCLSCRSSLGDLAPVFQMIRRDRMAKLYGGENSETSPARAPIDPRLTENIMGDVLDGLRVMKGCCRIRLCSAMLLHEHM